MTDTVLNPAQLTEIFHEYAPEDIISATRSTEAFANDVYDITDTQGQRFFLKILKKQLPEMIAIEANMQQHLLAAGIQSPEYLQIQPGNYIGEHHGTRFLLSKYIPGSSPTQVTPALIESFGETLAKLHDALQGIHVPPNSMQWLNPERVARDIAGYDGVYKEDLLSLTTSGKVIFERGLPTTVTHGDLWMSNVFAVNDTITTVFDLETAENTVRLVDLARTYTSMKFNSDFSSEEVCNLLANGYNRAAKQPLSTEELHNFAPAIAYVSGACATWHAVHGTRYCEPYLQLGKEIMES